MAPDINPSLPSVGQSNATEEPKIVTALTQLIAAVNDIDTANILDGTIDALDLNSALVDKLGISTAVTRRGKSIIPATETITPGATYTLMTTPDRVSNIVLPTDGLIAVAYSATWAESMSGVALAAIFIGANQLKTITPTASVPAVQETVHGNTATQNQPLYSTAYGLKGSDPTAGWTDVTTGQVIGSVASGVTPGGVVYIWAAAGTYDVSVKFKASSGSVTASNRRLWVWTLGF